MPDTSHAGPRSKSNSIVASAMDGPLAEYAAMIQRKEAAGEDVSYLRKRYEHLCRTRDQSAAEKAKLATQARSADSRKQGTVAAPEGKRSQSTELCDLARASYRIGRSTDGKAFAVETDGPNIMVALRGSGGLRERLAREYRTLRGKVPSQQALTDAIGAIEADAQDAKPEQVYLRVARHKEALILDLGDNTGRAVSITDDEWKVIDRSPVIFRRTVVTAALPEPVRGGTLEPLRRRLNVDDAAWPAIVGFLISALVPDIPHPVLGIFGEQGSAKSSTGELIMSVVDPSHAPRTSPPRNIEEWTIAANSSWGLMLENVSNIQPWLSDALCRAVTGDATVKRRLYADDEAHVIAFRRVVAFNGIEVGAIRGDLASRLMTLDLRRITGTTRRAERYGARARTEGGGEHVFRLGTEDHAQVLGRLLDLAVTTLATANRLDVAELPRLADFAVILAALDLVTGASPSVNSGVAQDHDVCDVTKDQLERNVMPLTCENDVSEDHDVSFILLSLEMRKEDGFTGRSALEYFQSCADDLAEAVTESSPFVSALARFLIEANKWSGTSAELLSQLNRYQPFKPNNWPQSAQGVGRILTRDAPALRQQGFTVESLARTADGRGWLLTAPGYGPRETGERNVINDTNVISAGQRHDITRGPNVTNVIETSLTDSDRSVTGICCGMKPSTQRGGPLVLACQLCRRSPTYHRTA